MPSGDHLNIIDPPGLTVMRIAGGRYRVTAAHRVIWTWMNEFVALTDGNNHNNRSHNKSNDETVNTLQIGDLVSMTIVDVFETDNQGKLLSYCPTFDNRAIHKTHHSAETLRKSTVKVMTMLAQARNSRTASLIVSKARTMAESVKQKVDEAVQNYNSPRRRGKQVQSHELEVSSDNESRQHLEPAMSAVEAAYELKNQSSTSTSRYHADDDTERHEV
jgi:hypothetical protein